MTKGFVNRFQKLEEQCRVALQELFPKKKFNFSSEYAPYDAWCFTKKNGKKLIYLIELKIRNRSYNEYILEQKKLDNLLEAQIQFQRTFPDREVKIFYLNFTPQGTFTWDLNQTVADAQKMTIEAPQYTAKASDKVGKSVYYLPVEKAIYTSSYTYNPYII